MEYRTDDKGYVIRCVDRFTGKALYRGSHQKYAWEKDSLRPDDTYTFTGAKKALANKQRTYPDACFYSTDRLSCYFFNPDDYDEGPQNRQGKASRPDYREKIYEDIEHAMVRLDELWEGNVFHNGDKMRINEVRSVLKSIKATLLKQQG